MTDEHIAEAITYARTHFGNSASKVDVEQVKQVKAALAGRAAPFTADELKPLLGAPGAEPAAAGAAPEGVAGEGGGAAPAAPGGAAPAAPAPATAGGAPAPTTP
jgi:hypothetical protein